MQKLKFSSRTCRLNSGNILPALVSGSQQRGLLRERSHQGAMWLLLSPTVAYVILYVHFHNNIFKSVTISPQVPICVHRHIYNYLSPLF